MTRTRAQLALSRREGLDGLTRDGARDAAREELSRRPYQEAEPPLLERAVGWVLSELAGLLDRLDGLPGGRVGLLLLALLLAAVVAVVLARVGPLRRDPGSAGAVDSGQRRTAADHRLEAERAAAAGRYADAVRERLRAVVRELEARGVLDPRPGRTALEVARDAGAALPELAVSLRRAAEVFDEIWYGGRDADPGAYREIAELDETVRATRRGAGAARA